MIALDLCLLHSQNLLITEIYKKQCKGCEQKRKIKSVRNFIGLKNNELNYKCKKCKEKKKWLEAVNGLIKKFPNIYQFCNGGINKFVSLVRKGIYPYEYMDSWERFDETSLTDKKSFYSESNLEDITDKDYAQTQKVFKELKLKNLGDYHDLYVQSDTLLLADVSENFRNKCIEIYELDPAHFLSAPGLAWQACLIKTGVKLELLRNNDMLTMVEKRIRGGICHAIHRYAKTNNKYMKIYNKIIESSYLMYLVANNVFRYDY